jgi:hypothetical protein
VAKFVHKVVRKKRGADAKRAALRENFWPKVEEDDLWLRTKRTGFTTIPRTMSLIGRLIDQLSGKGFPLFSTYFSLWCRVYDEAFVEIRNERELAFESGFSGPRGEVTWRSRMRRLQELGFVDIKPGLASDLQYVLIWNPIKVIARAYEGEVSNLAYSALKVRLVEIGATDLDPPDDDDDDDDDDDL